MAPTFMKLLMILCMAGSYAAGSSLEQATKGGILLTPNVAIDSADTAIIIYSQHEIKSQCREVKFRTSF
jgi:hypothetical protein